MTGESPSPETPRAGAQEIAAMLPDRRTNRTRSAPYGVLQARAETIVDGGSSAGRFGRGRQMRKDSDIGHSHAVTVGVFYQVHGLIGQMQQSLFGSRVHRV